MADPTVQDARPILDQHGRVMLITPWGERQWVPNEEGIAKEQTGTGFRMVRDPSEFTEEPTLTDGIVDAGLGAANSLSLGLVKNVTDLSAELTGERDFQRRLEESDTFQTANIATDIASLAFGPIKGLASAAGRKVGGKLAQSVAGQATSRAKAAEAVLLAEKGDEAARLSLNNSVKDKLVKDGLEYARLVKDDKADLAREIVKRNPQARDIGVALSAHYGEHIPKKISKDALKGLEDQLEVAALSYDGDKLRKVNALTGGGDIGVSLANVEDQIKAGTEALLNLEKGAFRAGRSTTKDYLKVKQQWADQISGLREKQRLLQSANLLDGAERKILKNLSGADEMANALAKARHEMSVANKYHKVDMFGKAIAGGAVEGGLIAASHIDGPQDAADSVKEIIAGAALGSIWNAASFGAGVVVDKAKKAITKRSGVDPDILQKTITARRFYEKRVSLAKQTGDLEELDFAMQNVEKLNKSLQSMRTQMFRQAGEDATFMSRALGYASGAMTNHIVGAMAYGTIGSLMMGGSIGPVGGVGSAILVGALTGAISRRGSQAIQNRIWNSMVGGNAPSKIMRTVRKMAKYGSYRLLGELELDQAADGLDDTQNVYRDAKMGYTMAGVDPIEAEALSQIAASQNDVLLKYLKRDNNTKAKQNEASLAVALATNPDTLSGLIASKSISERAVEIYAEMFPREARKLRAQALYIKKEFGKELNMEDRRVLSTISGQRKSTAMMMQAVYKQAPQPAPSTKKPDNRQWTDMQRISGNV